MLARRSTAAGAPDVKAVTFVGILLAAVISVFVFTRDGHAQLSLDCDYYRDSACCHCETYPGNPPEYPPISYCYTGAIIGVTRCVAGGSGGPGICEGDVCVGG